MSDHLHRPDRFGDTEVPPTVVEGGEHVVAGVRQGSICVHAGGRLFVTGTQQGSVEFRPESSGVIDGTVQGSVDVAAGARVEVTGAIQGSLSVEHGGTVVIAQGGRLAGSMHIDGVLENRGIRGGAVSGSGELRDLDGGTVKQPDEISSDGTRTYNW